MFQTQLASLVSKCAFFVFFLLFYQKRPWFSIVSSRLINLWVVQRFIKDGTLYAVWVMWMCNVPTIQIRPVPAVGWSKAGVHHPNLDARGNKPARILAERPVCDFHGSSELHFEGFGFWEVVKCWRRSITVVTWKNGQSPDRIQRQMKSSDSWDYVGLWDSGQLKNLWPKRPNKPGASWAPECDRRLGIVAA